VSGQSYEDLGAGGRRNRRAEENGEAFCGLAKTSASGKTAARNRTMLGRVWSTVLPPLLPSNNRWTAGIVII
jgi:hypothetical protein